MHIVMAFGRMISSLQHKIIQREKPLVGISKYRVHILYISIIVYTSYWIKNQRDT